MTPSLCDISPMPAAFDIGVLRRKLSEIMARKDVRPTTLSKSIGDSPTLVRDLLEKTRDTKLSTLYKIASALDVPVTDLLIDGLTPIPVGPELFVKGEVAAGKWVEAFEWPEEDWMVLTGRPDVTADIDHRFFLKVVGDSMNLIYPEGTFIECVSVFGRAEALPGKRVVVLRKSIDQLVEATVKELVETDGRLWAVPRSTNPSHQAICLDSPGEGMEEVRIAAVVVSSVRPE